jgi:hypothetical protein
VCRALEGDGADRNLPIREARPFRGVGGQFLDRHVERNIGQHQHVQRVVGGDDRLVATERDCHPDSIAEEFRRRITVLELQQVIGRGRGLNMPDTLINTGAACGPRSID